MDTHIVSTDAVKPEPSRQETEMATLLHVDWGNSLLRTLHSMRDTNDQCDVILTGDDGSSVNAHAAILCAASTKFKTELQNLGPHLLLKGVTMATIEAVLDFVYLGQVEVEVGELENVQAVAEQFELDQLVQQCQKAGEQRAILQQLEDASGEPVDGEQVGEESIKVESQDDDEDDDDDDGDDDFDAGGLEDQDSDDSDSLITSSPPVRKARTSTKRLTKTTSRKKQAAQNSPAKSKSMRLVCNKCGRKFKFKEGLSRHMPSHKDDDPFCCHVCCLEFKDSHELIAHVKDHQISAGNFKCAVCDIVVGRKTSLRTHVVRMHGPKTQHKCQHCGEVYQTKKALSIHRQKHTGQHPCEFCGREFLWRSNLKEHRRIHTGEKPFACIHCDKTFTHDTNRKVHQRWHHTHEDLAACDDKVCNDPRAVTKRKKPSLIYTCQVCMRQFNRKDSYTKHMHRHNGTHAFCCDYCGKGFMERECFDTHIKAHQGISSSFQCSVCQLVVTTKKGLQKHMRTMHQCDKKYQCTECGVTFVHRSSFVAHNMMHAGQKPYKCDQCSRTFRCSSHLKGHQRIHTGEKPYACSVCGQKFAHNNSRKAHEQQHHVGPAVKRAATNKPSKRKATAAIEPLLPPGGTTVLEAQAVLAPPVAAPLAVVSRSAVVAPEVGDWDTDGMYIIRDSIAEHIPLARMTSRDRQYPNMEESQGIVTESGELQQYTIWSQGATVSYQTRSEN